MSMQVKTPARRGGDNPERETWLDKPARPLPVLVLCPPDSALESEADRAADDVVHGRRISPLSPAFSNGGIDRGGPAWPPTLAVREAGGHIGPPPPLQTKGTSVTGLHHVRRALMSAGRPLDERTRVAMEARFDNDFSRVRLHDDASAHAAASALGASAFVAGEHIVFAGGMHRLRTRAGLHLLAHELAHVVQQRCAGLRNSPHARDLLFVQRFDQIGARAQTRALPAPPVRSFGPDESALGDLNQIRTSPDLGMLRTMNPAQAAPVPADNAQTTTALRRSQSAQREQAQGLGAEQQAGEAQSTEAATALEAASAMTEQAAEQQGEGGDEQQPASLGQVIEQGVRFAEPTVEGEFEDEAERASAMMEAQMNKTRAETAMSEFALKGVDVSTAMKDAGMAIEPQLMLAVDEASARISQSAATNREAIALALKEARGQVSGREAGAKKKLDTEYKAADKAIEDRYTSDKNAVTLHYGLKLLQFVTTELTGGLTISRIFREGAAKFASAGEAVASAARAHGEEYAEKYAAEYAPDGDFFDGEDYYRRKRSARVKASRETVKQYAESFTKQGTDAAAEVAKSDKDVIDDLHKQINQQRDAAQAEYNKALADLEASYKASKASAKSAYDAQQTALVASGKANRAAIRRLEKALLKQLDEVEQQQLAQTAGKAAFALEQLIFAVDAAATSLEQQLAQGLLGLAEQQAPDADALAEQMSESQAQLDNAQAMALEQIAGGVDAAIGLLLANADATAEQLDTLLAQAQEKSKPIVESFDATTTQAVRATVAGLKKTSADFVKGAADTREAGITGIDDAHQAVADYIAAIEAKIPKALEDKAKEFQGDESKAESLTGALYGKAPETKDIRVDIEARAEEAADAIKPAWKEIVAFVLTILITVIVAVAIAALVASGVGFGVGLLLAAGIGALGGVAKAGVEAWRADKPLTWKDVGKAAALGAVDGMLQFVGGRALKALKLPDTGWKKAAAEGGSNFVQGVGNDFAGLGWDALVDGKNVGWKDFTGSLALNAVGAGLNVGAGGVFGKTKLKASQFDDALYKGGLKQLSKQELMDGLKAKGKDTLINVTTNTLGDKELLTKAYKGELTLDDVKTTALKSVAQEGITQKVHYGAKKQRFADKDAPDSAPKNSIEDKLREKFTSGGKAWQDYRKAKFGGKKVGAGTQGSDGQQGNQTGQNNQPGQGQPGDTTQTQQQQNNAGEAQQTSNQTGAGGGGEQTQPQPVASQTGDGQNSDTSQSTTTSQTPRSQNIDEPDVTARPTQQPASEADANAVVTNERDTATNDSAKNESAAKPPADTNTGEASQQQAASITSKPAADADADTVQPPRLAGPEEAVAAATTAKKADEQATQRKPVPDENAAVAAGEPASQGKPKRGKAKAKAMATAGSEKAAGEAATAGGAGGKGGGKDGDKGGGGGGDGKGGKGGGRKPPKKDETEQLAEAQAAKQTPETALDQLQTKLKGGDATEAHAAAENLIKAAGDWKTSLKGQLAKMGKEERAQVEQALVDARDKIVADAFAKVQAKYPDVEMFNVGTKAFGSDIDITIKPRRTSTGPETDPAARKKQLQDTSKAALALAVELRKAVGGETDATLDTNVYAYNGEDDVQLKTGVDRQAQADMSRVAGLAEQKRGMTDAEWTAFTEAMKFKTSRAESKDKPASQLDIERAANKLILKDVRKAEAMADRLDKVRKTAEANARKKAPDAGDAEIARMAREAVLRKKRADLAREMGKPNPDIKKVLRLQTDISWFEPDAYAARAAIDLAVGGQTLRAAGSDSPTNKAIDAKLESIVKRLGDERNAAAPDKAKIAVLEDEARALLDQRHADVEADLRKAEDKRTARGAGDVQQTSGNKLGSAAGAASANLGMLKAHIAHADTLDGKVKAAAKYGSRVMQAENGAGLDTDSAIANGFGAFMQSRAPGLPKDDADAIAKSMLEDFAWSKGYVGKDHRPLVDDNIKRMFVQEMSAWAEGTTTKLHHLDATKRAAAQDATPKPPGPANKPKDPDPTKPTPEDDPQATVAKTSSKQPDEPAEAPAPAKTKTKGANGLKPSAETDAEVPTPRGSSGKGEAKSLKSTPRRKDLPESAAIPEQGLSGRSAGQWSPPVATRPEADEIFTKWADEDPLREIAMMYDPANRRYVVVQGIAFTVTPVEGMVLVKHFHPGTDVTNRLPSSEDFLYIFRAGGIVAPAGSTITYLNNKTGQYEDSTFGYHPPIGDGPPQFWIRFKDESGQSVVKIFSDDPWTAGSQYLQWRQTFEQGNRPSLPGSMTDRPSTPSAPGAPSTQSQAPAPAVDPAVGSKLAMSNKGKPLNTQTTAQPPVTQASQQQKGSSTTNVPPLVPPQPGGGGGGPRQNRPPIPIVPLSQYPHLTPTLPRVPNYQPQTTLPPPAQHSAPPDVDPVALAQTLRGQSTPPVDMDQHRLMGPLMQDLKGNISKGNNAQVEQLARVVWDALQNPDLIAQVAVQVHELSKRIGSVEGFDMNPPLTPQTRAIIEMAEQAGSTVFSIPKEFGDLGDAPFFNVVTSEFGVVDYNVGALNKQTNMTESGDHGIITHLFQDLVVNQAFMDLNIRGADGKPLRSDQFRAMLQAVQGSDPKLGQRLFIELYDAANKQLNEPETIFPLLQQHLRDLQ